MLETDIQAYTMIKSQGDYREYGTLTSTTPEEAEWFCSSGFIMWSAIKGMVGGLGKSNPDGSFTVKINTHKTGGIDNYVDLLDRQGLIREDIQQT